MAGVKRGSVGDEVNESRQGLHHIGPKAILVTSTFTLRWEPLQYFNQRMDMDLTFILTESFQLMYENISEKS